MNNPTANNGISEVVLPLNATKSPPANTANIATPLDSTNVAPRLASWRGRNPSIAMIPDNLGKSANAVLADRTRMAAVDACTRIYSTSDEQALEHRQPVDHQR